MRFAPSLLIVVLALTLLAAPSPATGQTAQVPLAQVGEPFPGGVYANLNGDAPVDLTAFAGEKPVALMYWIAGHPRADKELQELQALAAELGDKIAVLVVAIRQPGREKAEIVKRLGELNVTLPVLDDAGFRIGQQVRVQAVPHFTLLDKAGRLKLTNGGALAQVIGYQQTVESAIRRAAETGEVGTFGYLAKYYPVNELVGQKSPDFKAPLISTGVEQRWSTMIKKDHLNVLIFWSVDCPHCQRSLPEINAYLRQHGEGVNVISCAGVHDEVTRTKTKEFCNFNDFVFPTLVDQDLQVSQLYRVTTTPTILFIRPDGVIDSVLLSGNFDFAAEVEKKKRELL